ncbi:MAG: hypothetical protein QOE70_2425 [Chthoniobacter sp.]|jgi:sugar phosphate isomerase/epimerase|nr:hypothetical protein [Chthoniobacter sp.]
MPPVFRLLPLTVLLIAAAHAAAPPGSEPTGPGELARINGFLVAGHAWTWGKGTLFEAIEQTNAAGANALEVFLMGMPISAETGELALDENTPEAALKAIKDKCRQHGVRIINAYIGQKQWTRIGQDEAALRRFFVFGKKLGVSGFTGEPAERQWDMVERLLKEYDLTFAVHNHPKEFDAPYIGGPYRYWDPRYTAQKQTGRDPRFGICLDTGHAARSGLNNVEVLKAIAGRCLSVHLKDISEPTADAHDVPYGRGAVNVPALLAELRQQKFSGHLSLEYEWTESPTFATDVKGLVDFIREVPIPQAEVR